MPRRILYSVAERSSAGESASDGHPIEHSEWEANEVDNSASWSNGCAASARHPRSQTTSKDSIDA